MLKDPFAVCRAGPNMISYFIIRWKYVKSTILSILMLLPKHVFLDGE
jgi:hypothetical protein